MSCSINEHLALVGRDSDQPNILTKLWFVPSVLLGSTRHCWPWGVVSWHGSCPSLEFLLCAHYNLCEPWIAGLILDFHSSRITVPIREYTHNFLPIKRRESSPFRKPWSWCSCSSPAPRIRFHNVLASRVAFNVIVVKALFHVRFLSWVYGHEQLEFYRQLDT